jgi:hypothetical protein
MRDVIALAIWVIVPWWIGFIWLVSKLMEALQ